MTRPESTTMASSVTRRIVLGLGALLLMLMSIPAIGEQPAPRPKVLPGLEVLLRDHLDQLDGKRIGLVCNHTAVDSAGTHAIDLLTAQPEVNLVALYSPEHGMRGRVIAGEVADSIDEASGLPVYSLYGKTRKPTPAMLDGIDLLLFDMQDIGARFYTYSSTLSLVMQAAGEQGIPVWVLDRPNPTGGVLVQGNILDTDHTSFLGYHPIPIRHGMTMGELAFLFRGEFGVTCEIGVIPAEGLRRSDNWAATGLPWIPPSPSIWDPSATLTYPGLCFFEGTNLSIGGSTFKPYEVIAAPWLDPVPLAAELNDLALPGVHFECIEYCPLKPNDGKYKGEVCKGLHLQVTDPSRFDPIVTAMAALRSIATRYPDELTYRKEHMRLLAGSDTFLGEVLEAREITDLKAAWDLQCAEFGQLRRPYLLYQ